MHPPRGYVENVAAAICLATTVSQAAGRVYNVVEPYPFSELAWAQQIAAAASFIAAESAPILVAAAGQGKAGA